MAVADERPIGFGRMKRKEDPRFVRGQGNYVDDIQLPGMLHGAALRSPLAHARIVSIDTSAALQHPKVRAVITGKDLEAQGLAWMPTLSADTQAVLATDKVRFQGQEVAFVVADDHYAARDALELIDVDYEPLPVVVDAAQALDPDAPVIRDDKEGQTDNHIFDWEAGDKAEAERVFGDADVVVVTQEIPFQRVHPCPLETCGAVADYDGVTGKLRLWSHDAGAARAPHAVRDRGRAARAQDPGHRARHRRRLRQQGADLPRLRVLDRRVDRGRQAGQVDGGPDREPDVDRLRPRLRHAREDRRRPRRPDPRAARRRARRPRRVQRHRAADEVPGRVLPHLHRLLRPRGGVLRRHRRVHEQGAGRRRLSLLVPRDRGGVPRRADGRPARGRAGDGSRRAATGELHPARAVPVHDEDGLDVRLRRLRDDDAAGDARSPATRSCCASRRRSARGASPWASACRSSPRRSAPARGR